MERVHPKVQEWFPGEPVTAAGLLAIEQQLGVSLPASYTQFVLEHGSGEADTGDGRVILYPVNELLGLHVEPASGFAEAGLFMFGGNGGGEAFAFDLRSNPCRFVMVAFISNYERDRIYLGEEISDLFDYPRKFERDNA